MRALDFGSKRTWFIMAALAMVLVLAAACSGGDDDSSGATSSTGTTAAPQQPAAPAAPQAPTGTTSAPAAAAPAPTAVVNAPAMADGSGEPLISRLVISNPSPGQVSNNPGKDLGPLSTFQLLPSYEYLIGYDADSGALIPQLATSWTAEDDTTIRFQLRKDVQIHGGLGEFSAQDVVRTHAEISAQDSTHPHQDRYARVTPEVVNDNEIIFRLSRPDSELLQSISEQVGAFEIVSAADFDASGPPLLTTGPLAGTGLYQFQDRAQGQFIRFERVPYQHWRSTADFEELEFRWVAEASTRLAGLLTEEVHITQLPEDQTQQASNAGMFVEKGDIGAQRVFVGFKGGYTDSNSACGYKHCESPFLDVKVRKAMNKAVDRDLLNEAFFGNKGEIMVMNHIPPGTPAFNPAWESNFQQEYGYDPAAARALLAEAGYSSSNPLEIGVEITTHAQFSQSGDVLESLAGFWSDIGIKANLIVEDSAVIRASTRALTSVNRMSFSATSSFDIQGWRVYNSSRPPRGGALELIETDLINAQLQQEMDAGKQVELLRQIGDLAYPLHMGIFLYWMPPELVINTKFVSEYDFPGSISNLFTHFERIKAVRK